jgi:DNA-binding YbaB/EbfC family protein
MNPGMVKKLQKMQKEMQKAQKELEASIFYGQAGGKTVQVEFNGAKEMQGITIDKEAFDPEDIEMLEDTITAAVNDCMKKIDDETQETMGQFTQGLGMPGGF